MYNVLTHAHSGFRWVVLLLLVLAIGNAYQQWRAKAAFEPKAQKLSLYALIATHIQLLLGLVLYFISPNVKFEQGMMSDSLLRFYTVEHISLMLIAVILITVGYSRAKRAVNGFKTTFWFYLVALLLILVSIPWPFRDLGGKWF